MRKPYFPALQEAPEPLRCFAERVVRFEEVDPLGIVWHGRYPSYFEDGRVLLGERYGLGYMDFYHQGVVAPIKQMHIDYRQPLRFGDRFTIEAILHWTEATRINHEFVIRNAGGEITTTGYSVQLLLDAQQNLLMLPPPFYQTFRQRWLSGALT